MQAEAPDELQGGEGKILALWAMPVIAIGEPDRSYCGRTISRCVPYAKETVELASTA